MPNRKAKRNKDERKEKNKHLETHGRTPSQIKRRKERAAKRKSI